MGELATVGSSDGSLSNSESSESGGSQSGDSSDGLASLSLQVLDRELATYTRAKTHHELAVIVRYVATVQQDCCGTYRGS